MMDFSAARRSVPCCGQSGTCRTKAEWEAIQQRSIAAMEQVRDHHELQRHIQANRKDDQ